MSYKEHLYRNALSVIEKIYEESKYNPDVDLYRSFDIINSVNDAQIKSKEWLVNNLINYISPEFLKDVLWEYNLRDVIVLGSWYGVTGMLLREHIKDEINIWNIDSDPGCKQYSHVLQYGTSAYQNNYIITADAMEYYLDRTDAFQLIINTSCEHMDQEDLDMILALKPSDTIVCFQSNNYHAEAEHINSHDSLESFEKSLNLTRVFWSGSIKPSEEYERYMVIGI
jgi:hypothetical protein